MAALQFPNKKYRIIYADPPWDYKGYEKPKTKRWGFVSSQYNTMSINDLKKLPVSEIADDNCMLFMWATMPFLETAFTIMKAWGFTYKSIAFQWIKLNRKSLTYFYGLGRWTRGNTEPCLLATKGKPKRKSASVFQIVEVPPVRHSAKSVEVRNKIVKLMGDLPRIELFARERKEGWDAIGYDIDGCDIRDKIIFPIDISKH